MPACCALLSIVSCAQIFKLWTHTLQLYKQFRSTLRMLVRSAYCINCVCIYLFRESSCSYRTASALGICCVTVHSKDDAGAIHTFCSQETHMYGRVGTHCRTPPPPPSPIFLPNDRRTKLSVIPKCNHTVPALEHPFTHTHMHPTQTIMLCTNVVTWCICSNPLHPCKTWQHRLSVTMMIPGWQLPDLPLIWMRMAWCLRRYNTVRENTKFTQTNN